MTFWDKFELEPFDPTVPSAAEMLEDWGGAIQGMTKEHAIERVVCMAWRDRSTGSPAWPKRDTLAMMKFLNLYFPSSSLKDTLSLDENWLWFDSHKGSVAVVAHPRLDEEGLPLFDKGSDGFMLDRFSHWLAFARNGAWAKLYEERGNSSGFLLMKDGKPWRSNDAVARVLDFASKLGVPVLPFGAFSLDKYVFNMFRSPSLPSLAKIVGSGSLEEQIANKVKSIIKASGLPYEYQDWVYLLRWLDNNDPAWRNRVLHCTHDHPGWP